MKIAESWSIISILTLCWLEKGEAQINRPPRFVAGGDMAHFSIPEDVEVGSTIYKLRGTDPEEGSVYFSISGEHFSVNKYTGDVTLTEKLDREINDTVEVIVSITGGLSHELFQFPQRWSGILEKSFELLWSFLFFFFLQSDPLDNFY